MPIGLTEMYFRAQMPRLFETISRPPSQRPPKQTKGSASNEARAGFVYGCSCEQADRGARFVGRRVPDADEPDSLSEAALRLLRSSQFRPATSRVISSSDHRRSRLGVHHNESAGVVRCLQVPLDRWFETLATARFLLSPTGNGLQSPKWLEAGATLLTRAGLLCHAGIARQTLGLSVAPPGDARRRHPHLPARACHCATVFHERRPFKPSAVQIGTSPPLSS